jgi:hypothetical protein
MIIIDEFLIAGQYSSKILRRRRHQWSRDEVADTEQKNARGSSQLGGSFQVQPASIATGSKSSRG